MFAPAVSAACAALKQVTSLLWVAEIVCEDIDCCAATIEEKKITPIKNKTIEETKIECILSN